MNTDDIFVIELAGLPGMGKTTILRNMKENVPNAEGMVFGLSGDLGEDSAYIEGICEKKAWRKIAHGLVALLRYPKLHWAVLRYGLNAKGYSSELLRQTSAGGRSALSRERFRRRYGRKSNTKFLVVDQGFVQLIGGLSVPANQRNVLPTFSDFVDAVAYSRLHGVVWIEGDQSVALRRITNRSHGTSRFDVRSKANLGSADLDRFHRGLLSTVGVCRNSGMPVLSISASDEPAFNAALIMRWLKNCNAFK